MSTQRPRLLFAHADRQPGHVALTITSLPGQRPTVFAYVADLWEARRTSRAMGAIPLNF